MADKQAVKLKVEKIIIELPDDDPPPAPKQAPHPSMYFDIAQCQNILNGVKTVAEYSNVRGYSLDYLKQLDGTNIFDEEDKICYSTHTGKAWAEFIRCDVNQNIESRIQIRQKPANLPYGVEKKSQYKVVGHVFAYRGEVS